MMEEEWVPEALGTQHIPIVNSIDHGDYKQALRLVTKRLQKKTDDTYFRALQCLIQARHPQVSEKAQALMKLNELAQPGSKEVITDSFELEVYDHASREFSKGDDGRRMKQVIGKIRLAAVKAQPKDEKFAVECFKECIKNSDWEIAQQIMAFAEKSFPHVRKYTFYKLTAQLLYAESPFAGNMGGLMKTLAYRTLAKLAEGNFTAENGKPLPQKSLQTVQELLLYHRSMKCQGLWSELQSALMDSSIGLQSGVASGDWSMIRDIIELLIAEEQWEACFLLCDGLIEEACNNLEGTTLKDSRGGDWYVWNAYIESIMKLKKNEHYQRFRELNERHRAENSGVSKTFQRNARHASIKFTTKLNPSSPGSDKWSFMEYPQNLADLMQKDHETINGLSSTELVQRYKFVPHDLSRRVLTILEYLHDYGHVPAAFSDVMKCMLELTSTEREQLLRFAQTVMVDRQGWLIAKEADEANIGYPSECSIHFAPLDITLTDEVLAVTNHFKLSYMNSLTSSKDLDIKAPSPVGGQHGGRQDIDSLCKWCRVSSSGDFMCNQRAYYCEECTIAAAFKGINVYNHAVNGWPQRGWKPFNILATDLHPGDEAAIIVAMSLVKLGKGIRTGGLLHKDNAPGFEGRHGAKRLIQAAALLEFAHSKSPANPKISLFLVRLYSYLGAGSLAMRAYTKLRLKGIQMETLAYVLFDRISTLHPHPCADIMTGEAAQPFDPAIELERLQHKYRRFKKEITPQYWRSLDSGSYDSVFQLVNSIEKLSGSIGSVISVVELRKIARMTRPQEELTKSSHGYDILPPNVFAKKLHDNLDYKNFPNLELPHNPEFIHLIGTGRQPSDYRIRRGLMSDLLMMALKAPFEGLASLIELVGELDAFLNIMGDYMMSEEESCSAYEEAHMGITDYLSNIVVFATLDSELTGRRNENANLALADLRRVLEAVFDWLKHINTKKSTFIPRHADTLEPLYTAHQIAHMVLATEKFLNHKDIQASVTMRQSFTKYAGDLAREIATKVKENVQEVRKTMDNGGFLDKIVDWVEEGPALGQKKSCVDGRVDGKPQMETQEYSNDVADEDYSRAILGRGLRQVLDRDFLEIFASQLVTSWEESIIGLECLI